MWQETQFYISLAANLVTIILVAVFGFTSSRSIEKIKSDLARGNQLYEKRSERIADVISAVWACQHAFNEMITNLAKVNGMGEYEVIRESFSSDPKFADQMKMKYHNAASDFTEQVNNLVRIIQSNRLWLGNEIFVASMSIYDVYNKALLEMIKRDHGEAGDIAKRLQNIEKDILNLEDLAGKVFMI